jgi:hypothetical protein
MNKSIDKKWKEAQDNFKKMEETISLFKITKKNTNIQIVEERWLCLY